MTGLFCFDGPLYRDRNGIYCNVTLTDEMFKRYFSVVDKLYIVVRTYKSDKTYQELNMKPLTISNIEVVEVQNFNSLKGFIIEKKKFEKSIEELVRTADLIFARMPSNTSNTVLKVARKLKKRYLVENGGCAWDSYWNHGLIGKMVAPLMYLSEKKYVAGADYATYVTKEFLQRRYPNQNVTTNCSNVYLQNVEEKVLEDRINKIKCTDCQKVVFGQAVNSIDVKYKGEHLVLQAMGILKKQGIIIEYQVVGPGTGEFLLEVAKKFDVLDQFRIIGTLKKEEIFDWYKSIDVYIQPSKQEGLPRSVIEAMSVGNPCLGSRIAGIPELLDEECLFNPNSINTIVEAMKKLLNTETMTNQATINFERAKEYNIVDIENRRREIFLKYKESISNS